MATTVEKPDVSIQRSGPSPALNALTLAGMVVCGIALVGLTAFNVYSLFAGPADTSAEKAKEITLPDLPAGYDYWRGQATQQGGRYKPFETAAAEVMREVAGRNRWNQKDPTAVMLAWMLENDPRDVDPQSKWDGQEFILLENHGLRRLIFGMGEDGKVATEPTHEQVHGKYVAPAALQAFKTKHDRLRQVDDRRYKELFSSLERELGEAFHRLNIYHNVRKEAQTATSPMARDPFQHVTPFAFVALDKVTGAPWLAIDELRLIERLPSNWYVLMEQRVKNFPQLYLSPEHKEALAAFQDQVAAGRGAAAVAEIEAEQKARRDKLVAEYTAKLKEDNPVAAAELLAGALLSWPLDVVEGTQKAGLNESQGALQARLRAIVANDSEPMEKAIERYVDSPDRQVLMAVLVNGKGEGEVLEQAVRAALAERDERLRDEVVGRLPKTGYVAADPRFRMLHLNYLELRYPELYRNLAKWQEPPVEQARAVLAAYDAMGQAYRDGSDEAFAKASGEFFATVKKVSEENTGEGTYPGTDTVSDRFADLVTGAPIHQPAAELLELEQTFNRVKPFQWSWVLMLGSLLFFCLSLGFNSRLWYGLGFAAYGLSLALQIFGFFTRVVISGRAPVTNLYETVIWVAFMSGIFALILEAIYRRKVIAIAGALVATLALVLADQMPLALNPNISPLTPVLRSNFWLTIHVLTIVSSYAGGTLAWGLGNITLLLIIFGTAQRDTIKMLTNFTYRAMQIAVLLLATGTFLGGWWAAYSWGRFWGWDPKETGALIALVVYVIPLHMRYIGWIKEFGLAASAVVCYAAILFAWYGLNFFVPAGLHSYGFSSGGGEGWVLWAATLNLEWVFIAAWMHRGRLTASLPAAA